MGNQQPEKIGEHEKRLLAENEHGKIEAVLDADHKVIGAESTFPAGSGGRDDHAKPAKVHAHVKRGRK